MIGHFTNDWCDGHLQDWTEVLSPFVGKPGVRFVEIGSYEGRSALWFAENILTGDGSHILCVDPWRDYSERTGDDMGAVEARFDLNTADNPRIYKFKGTIVDMFEPRFGQLADMVYVDGSHAAADVLTDAVLAWQLLKVGGLLLLDDYTWRPEDGSDNAPALGIDAFLAVMKVGGRIEMVRSTKELIVVRKLA